MDMLQKNKCLICKVLIQPTWKYCDSDKCNYLRFLKYRKSKKPDIKQRKFLK